MRRPWWHGLPGVEGEVIVRCRYGDPLPNLKRAECERKHGRTPENCHRCTRVHVDGEPFRRLRCALNLTPEDS